jgi:hypothetical protein
MCDGRNSLLSRQECFRTERPAGFYLFAEDFLDDAGGVGFWLVLDKGRVIVKMVGRKENMGETAKKK